MTLVFSSHHRRVSVDHHIDPKKVIYTQRIWGITTSTTEGVLWTRRVDQGDRWPRRKSHANRPDWCRRNRQDICCSNCSPRRGPSVHPLRQVSRVAHSLPPPTLQGYRCGYRKPGGSGPPPIVQGNLHSPRQCRTHTRSAGNERSGNICSGRGAQSTKQRLPLRYVPDLHRPS